MASMSHTVSPEEEEFDRQDESCHTYPVMAGDLKRGDFVVIRGKPCKIDEIDSSKVGKHGHAKVAVVAYDIFTGARLEASSPSDKAVPCPFTKTEKYAATDVDRDGQLALMDNEGTMRYDLDLPKSKHLQHVAEGIVKGLEAGACVDVTVMTAMGQSVALSYHVFDAK
jgi:translation initiation factor 5A